MPGWRKLVPDGVIFHFAGPPMMFARQRDDGSWWVSVRNGAVEWHSYSHKTARAAMLAGTRLAEAITMAAKP
jgi:hypothetical protein